MDIWETLKLSIRTERVKRNTSRDVIYRVKESYVRVTVPSRNVVVRPPGLKPGHCYPLLLSFGPSHSNFILFGRFSLGFLSSSESLSIITSLFQVVLLPVHYMSPLTLLVKFSDTLTVKPVIYTGNTFLLTVRLNSHIFSLHFVKITNIDYGICVLNFKL